MITGSSDFKGDGSTVFSGDFSESLAVTIKSDDLSREYNRQKTPISFLRRKESLTSREFSLTGNCEEESSNFTDTDPKLCLSIDLLSQHDSIIEDIDEEEVCGDKNEHDIVKYSLDSIQEESNDEYRELTTEQRASSQKQTNGNDTHVNNSTVASSNESRSSSTKSLIPPTASQKRESMSKNTEIDFSNRNKSSTISLSSGSRQSSRHSYFSHKSNSSSKQSSRHSHSSQKSSSSRQFMRRSSGRSMGSSHASSTSRTTFLSAQSGTQGSTKEEGAFSKHVRTLSKASEQTMPTTKEMITKKKVPTPRETALYQQSSRNYPPKQKDTSTKNSMRPNPGMRPTLGQRMASGILPFGKKKDLNAKSI